MNLQERFAAVWLQHSREMPKSSSLLRSLVTDSVNKTRPNNTMAKMALQIFSRVIDLKSHQRIAELRDSATYDKLTFAL
jgi:hypothetical protein